MKRTCTVSGQAFEITAADRAFYEKLQVPMPTLCPPERERLRMTRRNERTLYWAHCAATQQRVLSMYHPATTPFPVYSLDHWWSDNWDPIVYGRDYDFTRPFFDQFAALQHVTPRMSQHIIANDQCHYVNQCGYSKHCYLSYNCDWSRDCLYATNCLKSTDILDSLFVEQCELGYQLINCKNCYNVAYLQNCQQCSDSFFLKNCIGCQHCFGSVNLRNKQYYWLNEPLSPTEYQRRLHRLQTSSAQHLQQLHTSFLRYLAGHPHRFAEILQSESCTGNYITNSKNCQHCFDIHKGQDLSYSTVYKDSTDCHDCMAGGYHSELCYEMISSGQDVYNCQFVSNVWTNCTDILYSELIVSSQHCFGCISLRNKSHCILNRQYSEAEYHDLKPKIIEHMKSTGEWGQFFPAALSPFAYNETVAQEYYPLTKEQALARGYRWRDPDQKQYQPQTVTIPDHIADVDDSICKALLACEVTGKNYKIQRAELSFYRKMSLPIPRRCPDQRHRDRMALRNPRQLYARTCAASGQPILTTYAPDRPERVLCEAEYLKVVV